MARKCNCLDLYDTFLVDVLSSAILVPWDQQPMMMMRYNRYWFGRSAFSLYQHCCLMYATIQFSCVVRSFTVNVRSRAVRKFDATTVSLRQRQMSITNHMPLETGNDSAIYMDPTLNDFVPNRSFFPIYYNDVYEVTLPPNHRFPMEKYRKVREKVQTTISSSSTIDQNSRIICDFRISPLATISELSTTHSLEYIQRFMSGNLSAVEIRNVGFPWSPSGVDRARSSVGGTIAAAVAVCQELELRSPLKRHGTSTDIETDNNSIGCCWSAHVAGGTHHAFYDYGEGFCVFSDIAVAVNVVLQRFPDLIKRILIIDLDVHQGNGNAVLFQGRDDVFTFSLHCSANYFSEKQASDLDIELPVDCNDETYLATLRHWLKQIQKHAGSFDLIFYQAGVDIVAHDRLGRMNVSPEGVKRRDALIFDFAANVLQIPMVITMGGGYPRTGTDWSHIIDAHANVYIEAYNFLSAVVSKKNSKH